MTNGQKNKAVPYNDYPDAMTANARRGRELNEAVGGRCATDVGKETARILANKETLSDDRVVRMFSFLSRAETYYDESDTKACGTIAYLLWGGKAAKRWSEARVKEMQERELSGTAKTALENKVEKHNEEVEEQHKKANLGMLEKVYNRGIGAYETNPQSVRPQVTSAEQWAMARVNSFLYALKNEKFRGGKHDTDLFPSGHPLRSDNEDERSMNEEVQTSTQQVQLEKQIRTMEMRAAKPMVLEGYAAVFDEETDLGAFREKIARGAFDEVLENDVRLLVDHNPPPLARTTNGTLKLSVDDRGLKYRAELVDTQAGRDLYQMVKRGDISQSSFAFTIAEQEYDDEMQLRTVTKVDQLFDVAPVTYPAYENTDVSARKAQLHEHHNVTYDADESAVKAEKKQLPKPQIIKHMNFKTSTDAQHHIHSLESKLESIQNVATSEERALTAEELEETQEIHNKLDMAEQQRDALAKNEARIKRMAQTGAPSVSEEKELAKVGEEFNLLRALNCAAHGRNLDGPEAEMLQEAQKESASMGLAMRGNIALPQSYLQLRNTYGNDTTAGPDTAVTTTGLEAAAVREALRPNAVIQEVGATQLTGFVGDIKLPTLPNDAASTPNEGVAATAFDNAMTSVTLTPQRYAAQITVTKEALNQATGNMQQVIARDFGNAIGAQIDRVAFKNMIDQGGTLSAGTLAISATAGNSRAQSEATIVLCTEGSSDDDIAVLSATDVANVWATITGNGTSQGAFVMHPKTAGALFNTNTTGAGGAPVLANNQIYGYNVVMTGTMPRLNLNAAKANQFINGGADADIGNSGDIGGLLYGDFSNVFWATWGPLSLTVDPFTGLSGGTVKIVADQFFDVKLRTPEHMGFIVANDTGAEFA